MRHFRAAFFLVVATVLLLAAPPGRTAEETAAGTAAPGVETFDPESPDGGQVGKIKRAIVWMGPLMTFLFLGIFNMVQMFKSRSGQETAAKVLVNCLGFILVFWIWNTFKIDHMSGITAYLTGPVSATASGQFWTGVAAAGLMFGFLFALEALGDLTAGRGSLQAVTVFLSCIGIYLLAPVLLILARANALVETRFFHISAGVVIGGIIYLIFLLFYLGKAKKA